MNDESVDLFDDSTGGTDNTGTDAPVDSEMEPVENGSESGSDIPDTGSDNSGLESLITGILDGYFQKNESESGTGGTNEENNVTGTETEDGRNPDGTSDAEGTGTENSTGTDLDADTGTDKTDADGIEKTEGETLDTEILSEMNETLHIHAENVETFFTDTVSGNAVLVTPDEGMLELLSQGIENQTLFISGQTEMMDKLDGLNASVMLLFAVLCFDMLHRFSKRIIRNLVKGDGKNGTNI